MYEQHYGNMSFLLPTFLTRLLKMFSTFISQSCNFVKYFSEFPNVTYFFSFWLEQKSLSNCTWMCYLLTTLMNYFSIIFLQCYTEPITSFMSLLLLIFWVVSCIMHIYISNFPLWRQVKLIRPWSPWWHHLAMRDRFSSSLKLCKYIFRLFRVYLKIIYTNKFYLVRHHNTFILFHICLIYLRNTCLIHAEFCAPILYSQQNVFLWTAN